MKRPNIPEPLHEAIENEARDYEDAWRETLERVIEQKTDITVPSKTEVNV